MIEMHSFPFHSTCVMRMCMFPFQSICVMRMCVFPFQSTCVMRMCVFPFQSTCVMRMCAATHWRASSFPTTSIRSAWPSPSSIRSATSDLSCHSNYEVNSTEYDMLNFTRSALELDRYCQRYQKIMCSILIGSCAMLYFFR